MDYFFHGCIQEFCYVIANFVIQPFRKGSFQFLHLAFNVLDYLRSITSIGLF